MFAQHQPIAAAQQGGVDRLIALAVAQQRRDVHAGFVGKDQLTHQRLLGIHRAAGGEGHLFAQRRQGGETHPGLDAQAALQSERHGLQRRVARPFAQAQHGGVHAGGPGAHRREGVGGGQPEIVMGVHLEFAGPDATQGGDLRRGGERVEDTDGIGIAQTGGSRLPGQAGNVLQRRVAGSRGVLTANADLQAKGVGEVDQGRQPLQQQR